MKYSSAKKLDGENVAPWLVGLLILLAVLFGRNVSTVSDPHGSLLVSQALIEHGTVRLDAYQQHFGDYSYQIAEKNGHFYYYFPLGTPLVATPFVGLAKLFGVDVLRHDSRMQLLIAAAILVLSYCLMQRIARFYLSALNSHFAASVFLFGTSFISTGATALWSHNCAALFALLAIYALLQEKHLYRSSCWVVLGAALFAAYLCRPTLMLLAPVLLCLQFVYVNRSSAFKAGLLLAALVGGFIAFSWSEFHQLLPDYYLPKRLDSNTFWLAVYGNLASPARGLFVYSPFLLLPAAASIWWWRKYPPLRLELALVIWPALHLIAISKFPHWWAGYSYGPRLMYDALPGFFLLFVVFLHKINSRSLALRFTVGTAIFAIAVNLGQGVFNKYAALWNIEPSVDQFPESLFDWNYPQFLHSEHSHNIRAAEFNRRHAIDASAAMQQSKLHIYKEKIDRMDELKSHLSTRRTMIGNRYTFSSNELVFLGWNPPETDFRWNDGHYAEIEFFPDQSLERANILKIEFFSIQQQTIRLSLNGVDLKEHSITSGNVAIEVEAKNSIILDQINVLKIEMPEARTAGGGDSRILSVAFRSLNFSN
jgi:hypothetical protein